MSYMCSCCMDVDLLFHSLYYWGYEYVWKRDMSETCRAAECGLETKLSLTVTVKTT